MLFDEQYSPILEAGKYKKYGENPHSSIITQLVGDFYEHLAAYILNAEVNNNTLSELPDVVSHRHQALVEVKGSKESTAVKVQVPQVQALATCQYQGWDRRWYFIVIHDASVNSGPPRSVEEIIEELANQNRFGVVLDVSIMQALLRHRVSICGPYKHVRKVERNGEIEEHEGWVLPRIASVRPKRDLTPLVQRTESALCELRLNPEDYDIHQEVQNRWTNPFILTWVLKKGTMKAVLKERKKQEKEEGDEIPF